MEDQEPFINLKDTTQEYTIQTLFKNDKGGVYFSKEPGFVAWVIPKKSDLDKYKQHIRQFTLDADLILGALADTATLVIIGRERESSLEELPPLQVETILLLASITEKELSQSLDVNDFLAGKMNNGRDWCPTYLSKELEHTEFGSLMTLTDILLKDWSEKGTIREYNYRYPHPSYYPFKEPLFRMLGLNELVYNWNTANALFAIDMEPATIYTLNRTGSLPVSYFNSPNRGEALGAVTRIKLTLTLQRWVTPILPEWFSIQLYISYLWITKSPIKVRLRTIILKIKLTCFHNLCALSWIF